ncbi:MAG: histidine phosphatase family protein [Nocardioides sp.]
MNGVVYLVRHGETALNADGRLRGHLDPPLNEAGEQEVGMLGAAFAELEQPPHRIVAGPLLRTRQTAGAIARALGLDVLVDDRLIDRDYGPWTGEPAAEVRARFGADLDELPDAEPAGAVVARAWEALEAQLPFLDEPVVLVSHDAVASRLLAAVDPTLGPAVGIVQDTACWNRLERIGSSWDAMVVNGSWRTLVPRP